MIRGEREKKFSQSFRIEMYVNLKKDNYKKTLKFIVLEELEMHTWMHQAFQRKLFMPTT